VQVTVQNPDAIQISWGNHPLTEFHGILVVVDIDQSFVPCQLELVEMRGKLKSLHGIDVTIPKSIGAGAQHGRYVRYDERSDCMIVRFLAVPLNQLPFRNRQAAASVLIDVENQIAGVVVSLAKCEVDAINERLTK